MQISEAIVHRISKAANSDDVQELPRAENSPINATMQKLAQEVLDIYSKTSNMYGTFDPDPMYQFAPSMVRYTATEDSLVAFSTRSTHLIAIAMKDSLLSTGGYVLFIRYENQGRDWLLIVMLKLKSHTGINEVTLDLNESSVFDIKHLNEAARIDLGKWKDNEQPYVSFVKRGANDEITRYFRRALGCTDYTDSKKNTEQALKAVDAFCTSIQCSPDEKKAARRLTYEYCDEKRKANEPVNLVALSARIFDQKPEAFIDYVKAQNLPINETFAPHRVTYMRFRRIRAKVGSVQVSFDVEDLLNDSVRYDPVGNALLVRNIPASLAEEIQQAQGNAAAA